MKIEAFEVTNGQDVIEIRVCLNQRAVGGNETCAVIGQAHRRMLPDWEPIESTYARALAKAACWMNQGPVSLRNTGGQYVART